MSFSLNNNNSKESEEKELLIASEKTLIFLPKFYYKYQEKRRIEIRKKIQKWRKDHPNQPIPQRFPY